MHMAAAACYIAQGYNMRTPAYTLLQARSCCWLYLITALKKLLIQVEVATNLSISNPLVHGSPW